MMMSEKSDDSFDFWQIIALKLFFSPLACPLIELESRREELCFKPLKFESSSADET